MASGNLGCHIDTEAPSYGWPRGAYKHHELVRWISGPKWMPPPFILLSVLCSGEDLGFESAGISMTWDPNDANLGAAWILARVNFFPLLCFANSMRGRRVSDLAGGVVHNSQRSSRRAFA